MMEKGIITFKRISPSRFLDSLRNCWQPTAAYKSEVSPPAMSLNFLLLLTTIRIIID